ncbi:MAG: lycopene cyclase domain-containing protein [Akkermansiaceae bacterium]|nr:lycopene cyclase domain-containing protein [Armatimonadota bacterium]
MTYSLFLLLFLCVPTVGLLIALRGKIARHHRIGLVLVNLLAFVYTTPWDNFAAYKKLWTFAPAFVWGRPFWFGYLPLEEYLFYFAEAVFVCMTMLLLGKVKWLRTDIPVAPPTRRHGGQTDAVR